MVFELPELEFETEYLVELSHELGFSIHNGMGFSPPSFQEIEAFLRLFSYELAAWEVQAIRQMCVVHCMWLQISKDRKAPPPVGDVSIYLKAVNSLKLMRD